MLSTPVNYFNNNCLDNRQLCTTTGVHTAPSRGLGRANTPPPYLSFVNRSDRSLCVNSCESFGADGCAAVLELGGAERLYTGIETDEQGR